jgi:hypothetical protein
MAALTGTFALEAKRGEYYLADHDVCSRKPRSLRRRRPDG